MRRTPLYHEHEKLKAKFTEFGGWDMPVFYSSIIDEHNTVRNSAGIFDASHMGEFIVGGKDAVQYLNKITITDTGLLKPGQCKYSMFLNEKGGIIDDILIYRRENDFFVVVNAGNMPKDWDWVNWNKSGDVILENRSEEISLIALQGPGSKNIMQQFVKNNLDEVKYYTFFTPVFNDMSPKFALISRTGYTGEDGFEIFINNEAAPHMWQKLVAAGVKPCGLGARDTLRLEAGMPLHGHEITDDITPVEAGLNWAVNWDKDFIGKGVIAAQKEKGPAKKLVAFVLESGIPRQNFDIISNGQKIGQVASGTFSPTLKKGIGTGFVNVPLEIGAKIEIMIHNQPKPAVIVKKPFYKRNKVS
ncbi:MAG: glycine cleavage system aminomethyltransferase GcvT [Elusimicrobiota bacterium]